ncbi:DNA polymerase III subunit delta' [Flexibacterium corallicola]|uniref:DNA polymerase III subunit delta' n=1 Tax=Flexibacterium corallicola TaxID=3037259 RepID=UPI00286EB5FD|nr:DNA polymerase III subunit delta' [Pseudovibrio sp. M1P-2-3]
MQSIEVPEADQLEGMALPREQSVLFGHKEAELKLLNAYKSSRFHHAWILGGPKGTGKATLAFRFAKFVLANPDRFGLEVQSAVNLNVPAQSHNARMVSAGSHADLLHLRRPWNEKSKRFMRDLPVSEVRKTVRFFGSTSAGGQWRVCLIDAADDMNANAANALLKILEEPPENCVFLVLSHSPGRLLPTIRSRCRRLDMRKLNDNQLLEALSFYEAFHDGEPEKTKALLTLANGSLRNAFIALESGGLELAAKFNSLTVHLPQLDMREAHSFAEQVSAHGADDLWISFLDLIRNFLSLQVGKGTDMPAKHLVCWTDLWEKVGNAAGATDALNLDRKQVVLSFLIELREVSRRNTGIS